MGALGDWLLFVEDGNSSSTGIVPAPLWSHQLGIEQDWMLTDPYTALSKCKSLSANTTPFDSTYRSWMTGGAGVGTIAPSEKQSLAWPPGQRMDIRTLRATAMATVATLARRRSARA